MHVEKGEFASHSIIFENYFFTLLSLGIFFTTLMDLEALGSEKSYL